MVGIIFGSATYEHRCTIDIEVEEEYRRKRIARRLTVEMLNHLLDRGYELQWDCTQSNEISRRVAESMGFEQIRERPYYWFQT
ncbi:MAG: GNAT family N-acetyltransferase [Lachnospiraceae bacterium]